MSRNAIDIPVINKRYAEGLHLFLPYQYPANIYIYIYIYIDFVFENSDSSNMLIKINRYRKSKSEAYSTEQIINTLKAWER